MKLNKIRITEFQSIQDSTEFTIENVTCLVGKNEAGKTALLKALYRLNPILLADCEFDTTNDYPRRDLSDYEDKVNNGHREPSQIIQATYILEPEDITAVEEQYGDKCLINKNKPLILHKGYSNDLTFSGLCVDTEATLQHLVTTADLSASLRDQLLGHTTHEAMVETLQNNERTKASQNLLSLLQSIPGGNISEVIFDQIIYPRVPKFLYFDEYYQMRGQDNLDALKERVETDTLKKADHPLLGLIELARLDLNQLTNPRRTEALIARLEGAENELTEKVLTYWSQNRHLRMRFDIRPAQPEDPEGMTVGTNILGRVNDTKHRVSTPLGTRSRGFIWFFSFLAWYSQLRKKGENIILLLDEPGLSLHAKAQGDLLRYFEDELKPHHQLIYTTHSPFMVDPAHFERVRIVQDLSIEPDSDTLPKEKQGTQVITEVLDATSDSLFPLQSALGYEISQTLFIGPNCLVVEGPSDLLYIQTVSSILQGRGKTGLSANWTITQAGGSGKVSAFVALIGAQTDLNVAILIDYQKKDQQSIERLYKMKLLKQSGVFTYDQFVNTDEADVEDMFNPEFYLKLVSAEFGISVTTQNLPTNPPRILKRLERYFKDNPLPGDVSFNHYRPARHFSHNIDSLANDLSEQELNRFEQAFNALNALL